MTADKAHHQGVAKISVAVVVRAQGGKERGRGRRVSDFSEALRGEEFNPAVRIRKSANEGSGVGRRPILAEHLDRLGAHFGVSVAEQRSERRERVGYLRRDLPEGPNGV